MARKLPSAWHQGPSPVLNSPPGVTSKPQPFVQKKAVPSRPVEDDPRSEVGLVFNEDLLLGYHAPAGQTGTKKGPVGGPPSPPMGA